MKDAATTISLNEPMAEGIFRMRFPVDWKDFDPGQFVMLSVPGGEVFLRRPFGIVRLAEGEAEICYKVVGKGTEALSRAHAGDPISVLGPCGRGFAAPAKMSAAVLVAGGYGIAPLIGLARRLREAELPVHVYYGAKDARQLLYLNEIRAMGAELFLTTEDGSTGDKGLVMDRLEREIDGIPSPALFACGPRRLIEAVAALSIARSIPAQVSLETCMACGIGVCLGCVCKNSDGDYVRTCREGPVFDAKELRWAF